MIHSTKLKAIKFDKLKQAIPQVLASNSSQLTINISLNMFISPYQYFFFLSLVGDKTEFPKDNITIHLFLDSQLDSLHYSHLYSSGSTELFVLVFST